MDLCICLICEELFNPDNDTINICDACIIKNDKIKTHEYKPEPVFYGSDVGFLGIELEVKAMPEHDDYAISSDVEKIESYLDDPNFWYYKNDNSIGIDKNGEGVELVSHPATLDYWQDEAGKDLDTLYHFYKKHGYTSHRNSTCGLHVHASKSLLGDDPASVIARLIILTEHIYSDLIKFSRRTHDQLRKWCTLQPVYEIKKSLLQSCDFNDDQSLGQYILSDPNYYNHGRKNVLWNLTHENTIELRLNKGTLNPETIMACIELAHAMVIVAKQLTRQQLLELNLSNIPAVAEQYGSSYDNLIAYLSKRGFYGGEDYTDDEY